MDYGLLLELHTLTQGAHSYALLKLDDPSLTLDDSSPIESATRLSTMLVPMRMRNTHT